MKKYKVTWVIDIEAESEKEAAKIARRIQLNPDSTATVFYVDERLGGPVIKPFVVDLLMEDL